MSTVDSQGRTRTRRVSRGLRWRRWLGWALVLSLALAAAGVFGALPAYRALKRKRGKAAAARAETAMQAGRMEEALHQVRLAYSLSPAEPEVLRVVAAASLKVGSKEAFGHYQSLLSTGQARFEDRMGAVEAAMRVERGDISAHLLRGLVKEDPKRRDVWRLAQDHAARFAPPREATDLARHVLNRFPGDPEAEVRLGGLLVMSLDPQRREEGRTLLRAVAVGGSEWRGPAARLLARTPELGRTEAAAVARVLEGMAGGGLEDRLLAAKLRIVADSAERPQWLERVAGWVTPESPVDPLVQVTAWLQQEGGMALSGRLLPVERCRTNLALLGLRLDYLVEGRHLDELIGVLDDEGNLLDAASRAATRGAALARLGRLLEAEYQFLEAMERPGRMPWVLPYIAREAERAGLTGVMAKALRRWMEVPGAAMGAGRRLLDLLGKRRDMVEEREALRRLHELLPGDEWVTSELLWSELITGGNVRWALDTAQRHVRAWPRDPGTHAALALARWRSGALELAARGLEEFPTDRGRLGIRERIAHAVVLNAIGRREAARRMISGLPEERLREQMNALIREIDDGRRP